MIGGVSSTRRAKQRRQKEKRRKRDERNGTGLARSAPPRSIVSTGRSISDPSSPASMPILSNFSDDESYHTPVASIELPNEALASTLAQNQSGGNATDKPRGSPDTFDRAESSFRDEQGNEISADDANNPVKHRYDQIKTYIADARNLAGNIVNNERVQLFIVALISINGIMMGIATFDFVTEDPDVENIFEQVDFVFLIIFTVELCLQFVYRSWRLFTDGWLLFDFVIIFMSWAFQGVQIIRAFRIFRALRLVTRVEVMKNLVSALFSVVPKMFAIGLLLMLVFYIFAVMYTTLFKEMFDDGTLEYDYFGTLWLSLFTCFQFMTLDDWNPIAREVMAEKTWAWLPFIAFIIVSGFIIVNLIIAVICDAVSALQDADKANLYGNFDDHSEDSSRLKEQREIETNGENGPPVDRRQALRRESLSSRSLSDRQLLMTIAKDKGSHRILQEAVNTERIILAQKVDILESQIEELTKLQRRGTIAIEMIMKHIQAGNIKTNDKELFCEVQSE